MRGQGASGGADWQRWTWERGVVSGYDPTLLRTKGQCAGTALEDSGAPTEGGQGGGRASLGQSAGPRRFPETRR